jgi:hypothetical protein
VKCNRYYQAEKGTYALLLHNAVEEAAAAAGTTNNKSDENEEDSKDGNGHDGNEDNGNDRNIVKSPLDFAMGKGVRVKDVLRVLVEVRPNR